MQKPGFGIITGLQRAAIIKTMLTCSREETPITSIIKRVRNERVADPTCRL
jgi:hypothetical protein